MDRTEEYRQLLRDYRTAFNTEAGSRVLKDLTRLSSVGSTTIMYDVNGQIDVNSVLLNEGRRSLMLDIQRKLNTDPDEKKQEGAVV